MGGIGRIPASTWGGTVTDISATFTETVTGHPFAFDDDLFSIVITHVSSASPEDDGFFRSQRGGLIVDGPWHEVCSRIATSASTSAQGSLVSSVDMDPHPTPVATSRIQQLKEDSGLTWDQLCRLFGVSRRSLHLWAAGGRMNSRNEERLAYLEQVVKAIGSNCDERRDALLKTTSVSGRTMFQQLLLSASKPASTDIEALTESTGTGRTVHGDFLFAEVIEDR